MNYVNKAIILNRTGVITVFKSRPKKLPLSVTLAACSHTDGVAGGHVCHTLENKDFQSTQRIDRRLGYFQGKFALSGSETRYLSTKQPRIITYNLHHINTNTFVIREEMGFEDNEVKALLLSKPRLWMINQRSLLERFNYIHNVIKIPHATILKHPEVLQFRTFKVKQRHLFLDKLGRAQFNPNKENYVPMTGLVEDTDAEFCKKYAKCNVDDLNIFLKTL